MTPFVTHSYQIHALKINCSYISLRCVPKLCKLSWKARDLSFQFVFSSRAVDELRFCVKGRPIHLFFWLILYVEKGKTFLWWGQFICSCSQFTVYCNKSWFLIIWTGWILVYVQYLRCFLIRLKVRITRKKFNSLAIKVSWSYPSAQTECKMLRALHGLSFLSKWE